MEPDRDRERRRGRWDQGLGPGVVPVAEAVSEVLDSGSRRRRPVGDLLDDEEDPPGREYRARTPTNSERLNRALRELSLSGFKVHLLLWKWRGAPARGVLPYFTIHSLGRFCLLSRPTVRVVLRELVVKGWIERLKYNKHHKNTLYRLVPIRKVPGPGRDLVDRCDGPADPAEGKRTTITNS